MASIYQQNKERRRAEKIYTKASILSEEEKNKVIKDIILKIINYHRKYYP